MIYLADRLKDVNEEVILLRICTRYLTSHKYLVIDGVAHYRDRFMTPREAYEAFLIELPMFEVMSAEIIHRVPDDTAPRGYRWTTLERFDR